MHTGKHSLWTLWERVLQFAEDENVPHTPPAWLMTRLLCLKIKRKKKKTATAQSIRTHSTLLPPRLQAGSSHPPVIPGDWCPPLSINVRFLAIYLEHPRPHTQQTPALLMLRIQLYWSRPSFDYSIRGEIQLELKLYPQMSAATWKSNLLY